jgi:hypothetical protein
MRAQFLEVFLGVGAARNGLHFLSQIISPGFVCGASYHEKKMTQQLIIRHIPARSEEPATTNIVDFKTRRCLTQAETTQRLPQPRPNFFGAFRRVALCGALYFNSLILRKLQNG